MSYRQRLYIYRGLRVYFMYMEHVYSNQVEPVLTPPIPPNGQSSFKVISPPRVQKECGSKNDSPSFPIQQQGEFPIQPSYVFPGSQKIAEKIPVAVAEISQSEGLIVQPGEYRPEYGPLMYEWFSLKTKTKTTNDTFTWKDGSVSEKKRTVPNPPPHFSEYARTLGTTWAKLKGWSKAHPEFAEYYEACVDIIQEFIIDNGITGQYSSQFGIFAAKNLTKMKDVVVNRNENWNMKEVLDAIEKGVDPDAQHDI